jgi:8-oxo-dGTP pyrophosphatase MutT (NUDIX family)
MEPHRIRTAGGIVLGDHGTIALILSKNSGAWLFPKGHVEEGETDEEASLREIQEETGLTNLEYIDDLGGFERIQHPGSDGIGEIKEVRMFLYAAEPHAELAPTLEIEAAQWVPLKEVINMLGQGVHPEWFAADRAWFTTVFERVRLAIQRD